MGTHVIRMPDIGEGIAEAELVEWVVALGDRVKEDDTLATVMTDKATVDIPSPVSGKVTWLGGELGALIAVGAELIRLEVEGEGNARAGAPVAQSSETSPVAAEPSGVEPAPDAVAQTASPEKPQSVRSPSEMPFASVTPGPLRAEGEKPLASPSVRGRARDAGIDLRQVRGSGGAGRITHDDLEAWIAGGGVAQGTGKPARDNSVSEVRVMGLRRKIAERMQLAKRTIAHITIVEEIDVTALEDLRSKLNAQGGRTKLTLLPFVMKAMVLAVHDQPGLNAHYDDEANVIRQFAGVHIGIATQTPGGLMVPVVQHAETLNLWQSADEVARVAEAARTGTAAREELSGSTITISSLGPLGALSTTPIINRPEVAIVGINRMAVRPHWDGAAFVPRKMMNISCSFDHRVIDGWDAAVFIQRLKALLETPALMFVEQ
ncbi:dihydrolipoamide acetyltransferase family protein [Pseudomonas sp. SLFW]|uniref:dihydrolipoamide acetyltransferase family protein n=1 Tax=Pseudomonas sp. SLFW TaxID=2683259 RepID=UPI0014130594|nr:dihydrolipoamide acetyltransferase family protein [Pseudomonas sp. SLFW]NBB13165.1 2-oxo acid dehydrogenase subunit E2 [Pseudomonas sp. SLFW]